MKGKNDGRKRTLVVGREEPVGEVHQRGLEIDEGDALVHRQPLDLGERRRVRGVEGIVPVDQARDDDADRRRRLQQGSDLHRRRVGAQQQPPALLARDRRGIDVQRVVHVHRRMVRGKVQRDEVVPLGFDLGTDGDGEAEPAEDLDDLIDDPGDRVLAPTQRWRAGMVRSSPACSCCRRSVSRASLR